MSGSQDSPPPLPAAGGVAGVDAVLVTADREKLPPGVAALLDAGAPLPAGVAFYERRVTGGDVLLAAVFAVLCAGLAVVCIPAGVYYLFHPIGPVTVASRSDTFLLGVGAISALIAWVMASSVIERVRLWGEQRAGRPTRCGIFLSPAALIDAGDSAVTVLPRGQVRGVDGRTVHYRMNGADKNLKLPQQLMNASAAELNAAVSRWAT